MAFNFIRFFYAIFFLTAYSHDACAGEFSKWMERYAIYIEKKSLKDVVLPGTHDSATYTLSAKSSIARNQEIPKELGYLRYVFGIGYGIIHIIAKWGKAQGKNIKEQLNDGIRYLDLRVVYRESAKTHYSVHGLYGQSIDDILKDIKEFIDENPKEIIIVQIGDFGYMGSKKTGDTHEELINKISTQFQDKLTPKNYTPSITVQKLWSMKKQLIVIYNDKNWVDKKDFLWSPNTIDSKWANTTDVKTLKERLDSYFDRRNPDQFFVLQSQLTPDENLIKKSLAPFYKGPQSLKDLAESVKKEIPTWLESWRDKSPNIIIADFLDDPAIIENIINLNMLS